MIAAFHANEHSAKCGAGRLHLPAVSWHVVAQVCHLVQLAISKHKILGGARRLARASATRVGPESSVAVVKRMARIDSISKVPHPMKGHERCQSQPVPLPGTSSRGQSGVHLSGYCNGAVVPYSRSQSRPQTLVMSCCCYLWLHIVLFLPTQMHITGFAALTNLTTTFLRRVDEAADRCFQACSDQHDVWGYQLPSEVACERGVCRVAAAVPVLRSSVIQDAHKQPGGLPMSIWGSGACHCAASCEVRQCPKGGCSAQPGLGHSGEGDRPVPPKRVKRKLCAKARCAHLCRTDCGAQQSEKTTPKIQTSEHGHTNTHTHTHNLKETSLKIVAHVMTTLREFEDLALSNIEQTAMMYPGS